MSKKLLNQEYQKFLGNLKNRVTHSQYKAILSVNQELVLLYHHIGKQILESQARHGWGAKIIDQL